MKDRRFSSVRVVILSILIVILFSLPASSNLDSYWQIFREAFSLIQQRYIEPVAEDKILEGAIEGVLENLDENSYILSSLDSTKENPLLIEEIGILLSRGKDGWQVVTPLVNSPAWRAGIRPGDKLDRIDDQEMSIVDATPLIKKLSGSLPSKVSLTFVRQGETQKYTLSRQIFQPKIIYEREENIGYIRIIEYPGTFSKEFEGILFQFQKEKIKGLILDLRNNPGCMYSPAGEMASQVLSYFLPAGKMIASTLGRTASRGQKFFTSKEPVFPTLPLVILVNQGTAGISEIIAGALKDYERANLVGVRTYGNASESSNFHLEDGKNLHLTVADYYTPQGRLIRETGVSPDREIVIPLELELKIMKGEKISDPQRDEAFSTLRAQK